jgi:hypothetical protein
MAAGEEITYTVQGTGGLSRPRIELRSNTAGPAVWYKERHLDDASAGTEIVAVIKVRSALESVYGQAV